MGQAPVPARRRCSTWPLRCPPAAARCAGVPAQSGAQEAVHAGPAVRRRGRARPRAGRAAQRAATAAPDCGDRGLRRDLARRQVQAARLCHVHGCGGQWAAGGGRREHRGTAARTLLHALGRATHQHVPANRAPVAHTCADNDHSDIPVPDFTWYCYPEARYRNSSWPAVQVLRRRQCCSAGHVRHVGSAAGGQLGGPAVKPSPAPPCAHHSPQDLLQRRSDMVGWHERHPELFHRSNWAVGPRRGLMPLLQTYDNGTGRSGWRRAAVLLLALPCPEPTYVILPLLPPPRPPPVQPGYLRWRHLARSST